MAGAAAGRGCGSEEAEPDEGDQHPQHEIDLAKEDVFGDEHATQD
jgi:hypothetical protein